eukprot:scaffold184714_cov33-Cyclotella_meneghiniana.AAC.1
MSLGSPCEVAYPETIGQLTKIGANGHGNSEDIHDGNTILPKTMNSSTISENMSLGSPCEVAYPETIGQLTKIGAN